MATKKCRGEAGHIFYCFFPSRGLAWSGNLGGAFFRVLAFRQSDIAAAKLAGLCRKNLLSPRRRGEEGMCTGSFCRRQGHSEKDEAGIRENVRRHVPLQNKHFGRLWLFLAQAEAFALFSF